MRKDKENCLKKPIPLALTEDITFLAFRLIGKIPVIDFREGYVFHVLCIDADFSVYNHGSKKTTNKTQNT